MIYTKKISIGNFLKKGEDFKEDDLLEIANEGKKIQGNYGEQDIFLAKIGDKEGNISVNQTSINGFIDAFGPDSLKWIGKQVKAWKVKQNVAGKFIDVWYFAHPDAALTEDGFVLPIRDKNVPQGANIVKEDDINAELETIQDSDIPF